MSRVAIGSRDNQITMALARIAHDEQAPGRVAPQTENSGQPWVVANFWKNVLAIQKSRAQTGCVEKTTLSLAVAAAPGASDPLALQEQRARDFLETGRYRKARDEIKPLCKINRAKYLPLLIQANQGLMREMISKGQISEAQQVLAYLKTIAPPSEWRALDLELAARGDNWNAVLANVVSMMTDSRQSLTESEKQCAADRLVLTFLPIPAGLPGAAQLAGETQAVHDALRALAEQQFERVQEALRLIPHGSIFGQWKMFVKGLVAFYSGDFARAGRFFLELPADSVTEKACRPYLVLMDQTDGRFDGRLSETAVEAIGHITGQPALGSVLSKADRCWKNQRPADSYRLMRALADFPSDKTDALGALSDFYFNALFVLPHDIADSYAQFLEELEVRGQTKSAIELQMILRVLPLYLEHAMDPLTLKLKWESFVRVHEQTHGASPRLASLAHAWLGRALAEPRQAFGFFCRQKTSLRDPAGAVQALRKSVELDPAHLDAHLKLCAVYESLKKFSERNRLLDVMTQQFPDDKEVLLQAGRGCLDRKAYLKGLEYLERAHHLDPLDASVADLIVAARFRLVGQHFRAGRHHPARQGMEQIKGLVVEKPDHFARNRWCVLTRHGLLEETFGDRPQGELLLAQARAASPFPAAFLFFAQIARRVETPAGVANTPFRAELEMVCKENASIAHAATLFRIYRYWKLMLNRGFPDEENLLRQYLRNAIRKPFTRPEAVALLELAESHPSFRAEIQNLVNKMLAQDPDDPLFRLHRHLLQPGSMVSSERARGDLQAIIKEAARRGDDKTAQLARNILDRMSIPPPLPLPMEDPFEELFEDEDEDGDFPGLPAEQLEAFQDTIAMLAGMSEAERRKTRKSLSKHIPDVLLDLLMKMSRNGGLPPLPPLPVPSLSELVPKPPAPSAGPKTAPPSPAQLNLFNP
ncbi:MAG: hypothetical protein HY360_15465 [Verrucomicrobia bacterium]|nr:hypothetical protein [Verrucomicrobiota bacterium]